MMTVAENKFFMTVLGLRETTEHIYGFMRKIIAFNLF